jgi:hypothetical protein
MPNKSEYAQSGAPRDATEGPLFSPVIKSDRILPGCLTAQSVALAFRMYAQRAELGPRYSPTTICAPGF